MDANAHPPRSCGRALIVAVVVAVAALALAGLAYRQFAAKPAVVAVKRDPGPDHQALIADRSPAVLARGADLYAKNCAACHGPGGDSNPANVNPVPRMFKSEAMKNPLGGGPYAWYQVLTNGYGAAMPGFRSLPPADRYAVAHFVRETWVKPNPALYVENDAPEVARQIPAKGGTEVQVDLAKVAPPAALRPVEVQQVAGQAASQAEVAAWLGRVRAAAGEDAGAVQLVAAWAAERPAGAVRLLALARSGAVEPVAAALVAEDGSGSADPALVALRREALLRLAGRLVAGAAKAP